MPDNTEQLKTMLQDIINNRSEQAEVTLHDYFIAKTREVAGLAAEETVDDANKDPEPGDDDPDDENND
jgi:hypothetical protein